MGLRTPDSDGVRWLMQMALDGFLTCVGTRSHSDGPIPEYLNGYPYS
jgi:hypothetical protein